MYPPATPRDLLAWLVGRRTRYRVQGPSMMPVLPDGTTILIRQQAPRPDDVVVARLPGSHTVVIKRVHRVEPDGRLFLRGDGARTTDSRDYGAVPTSCLLGVVVCTFP